MLSKSWSRGGARDPSRVVPKDARTCRFTPPTIFFENDPRVETEPTPRSSSRDCALIPGSASGRGRGDPSAVTPRDESASRVRSVARVHRPGAWPMQEPAGTGAAAGRHNPVPESAFRVVYFRGDRAEVDTRAGSSGTQFKIPRPAASEPPGLAGAPPPRRTRRGVGDRFRGPRRRQTCHRERCRVHRPTPGPLPDSRFRGSESRRRRLVGRSRPAAG